MRRFLSALTLLFLALPGLSPAAGELPVWIWKSDKPVADEKVFFFKEFELPEGVAMATITVACDDWHQVWINSADLGFAGGWTNAHGYDVTAKVKAGHNVIAVEGRNNNGAAGMALRFSATLADGKKIEVLTDGTWACGSESAERWYAGETAPAGWQKVVVVGTMGDKPWGKVIGPESEGGAYAVDATQDYQVAAGFKLERLYRVPKPQGSWVAMTVDGKGRLLCADQYGEIYRVTPAAKAGDATLVEPTAIPLQGAHGLLWHQGVLYVTVNEGKDESGVWKVTDSDGDGDPDKPELIKAFKGRGEHGPHGLVASPDGQWIYFAAGNHTDCPPFESSLVNTNWGEDQLLPRRPDPRGHARDRMAPGGFFARFRPDGSQWQLFAVGFRNQYDMAFNAEGDLFTYDSDMEWDFGMPWYRPTRICHVVPGAEFGWRNGSGVWPSYYEDSMPGVLDIGPGSPTGVVSGKGAKFPAKYQRAVYALDWTYATIHAIHLTPDGASYKAEREEFVAGRGLPVTDATIGVDGAIYFLTGGRKTDSALWRVTYTGGESIEPVAFANKDYPEPGEDDAFRKMASGDRVERQIARAAFEAALGAKGSHKHAGPTDGTHIWQTIDYVIATSRTMTSKTPEAAALLMDELEKLPWDAMDKAQKLGWLRACELIFIRSGEPGEPLRQRVLVRIDSRFPAGDEEMNRELCRMLAYLQAPGIVPRTLDLMDATGPGSPPDWLAMAKRNPQYGKTVEAMIANLPPAQVIHYVNCLRVVKGPWKLEERQRFFAWFDKLKKNSGGASYGGFIEDLKREALATATPEEREAIAKFGSSAAPMAPAERPVAKGPGHAWTVDEVAQLAESGLDGRDKTNGKRMFQAAMCSACHRFAGEGGAAGPDLSALGGRFSARDIAESILDPSKVISDQYSFELITKTDGSQVTGKMLDEKDDHWIVAINPFDFSQTVEIERNQIKERKPSPVSPMPPALINSLNPDELKDLLAYLMGK
ncbi:c-type cytochrome [Luteolibacter sp. Populi]|uniref:c-type cytochrome n=1 Tax=Luteolibacter sp. Populi TaxID=3230487 RepID=UPI003465DF30